MARQDPSPNEGVYDAFETFTWEVGKERFITYSGMNCDAITDIKELKRLRKALDKLIQRKENAK